jgi:hypothetical protein
MSVVESGTDVVCTYSGSMITDNSVPFLTGSLPFDAFMMMPNQSTFYSVPGNTSASYFSLTVNDGAFGTSAQCVPDSHSGDSLGMEGGALVLASNYVSGSLLGGTMTFSNNTLASLGLTEGVYTYAIGNGTDAEKLVLTIGAVPEPATYAAFLGIGALGLCLLRRRAR